MEPWKILNSRTIYSSPFAQVSTETVELPDGRVIDDYHRVALPDFVTIIAEIADGRIIVERQYKHGPRCVSLTLPAGQLEAGEEPLDAARRELLEETGYEATKWQPLGAFVLGGNAGIGTMHIFRAQGAHKVTEPFSGDLEDMQIELLAREDLASAFRAGEIPLMATAFPLALLMGPEMMPAK